LAEVISRIAQAVLGDLIPMNQSYNIAAFLWVCLQQGSDGLCGAIKNIGWIGDPADADLTLTEI
jgi:hypothetical protein